MLQFSLGQFASRFFAPRPSARCRKDAVGTTSEALECRTLLTSQFTIDILPNEFKDPGDQDIVFMKGALNKKWTGIEGVHIAVTGTSTAPLGNAILAADVFGSDGKPGHDGILDILAVDTNSANATVDFTLDRKSMSRVTRHDFVYIIAGISAGADAGTVGLDKNPQFVSKHKQGITVTGYNPVYTINAPTQAGNLFVTAPPNQVPDQYLLAGVGMEEIIDWSMRTDTQAVNVDSIFVSLIGSTVQSVEDITIYNTDGLTFVGVATRAAVGTTPTPAGYTTYCLRLTEGQLVIAAGEHIGLGGFSYVFPEADGGVAGEQVQPVLLGSFASFQAHTLGGTVLHQNNGDAIKNGEIFIGTSVASLNQDIVGEAHTVVTAELDSAMDGSQDPLFVPIPEGVYAVAQVTMTAADNVNEAFVANDRFVFVIDTSNVEIDPTSILLSNKNDASITVAPTDVFVSDGAYVVTFDNLALGDVDTWLPPGGTATYVVTVNIQDGWLDETQDAFVRTSMSLSKNAYGWFDVNVNTAKFHQSVDGDKLDLVLLSYYENLA